MISRRSILQLLGLSATAPSLPAQALANTVLATASTALPVMDSIEEIKTGLRSGPGKKLSALQKEAVDWLEEGLYGKEDENIGHKDIRPAIACFKSASPCVKALWEAKQRRTEYSLRRKYRKAIDLIYGD